MPMEHIQGYTGSHWMPPSGECLRCIAPVAAMVTKIGGIYKKKTNKTQLLASNYSANQSLVVYEIHHYKGSGGIKKLLLHRFGMVGLVWKVPSTINITQYQTSPQ